MQQGCITQTLRYISATSRGSLKNMDFDRADQIRRDGGFLTIEDTINLIESGNQIFDPFSTLIAPNVQIGTGNVFPRERSFVQPTATRSRLGIETPSTQVASSKRPTVTFGLATTTSLVTVGLLQRPIDQMLRSGLAMVADISTILLYLAKLVWVAALRSSAVFTLKAAN